MVNVLRPYPPKYSQPRRFNTERIYKRPTCLNCRSAAYIGWTSSQVNYGNLFSEPAKKIVLPLSSRVYYEFFVDTYIFFVHSGKIITSRNSSGGRAEGDMFANSFNSSSIAYTFDNWSEYELYDAMKRVNCWTIRRQGIKTNWRKVFEKKRRRT